MEFTNSELVTLAIIYLEGYSKSVDIEDIAIKAYFLSPKSFCWKKHPDRIDLRVVQDSLKKAKTEDKPKITGSIRNGYQITLEGKKWFDSVRTELPNIKVNYRKNSIDTHIAIEINRLIQSNAYIKYLNKNINSISKRDFEQFTRVNDYFPLWLKKQKFNYLNIIIDENIELKKLWQILKNKFFKMEEKDVR